MTTFIDTSVLIDVAAEESAHHAWSVDRLNDARARGPVIVSDIVYCEFAVTIPEQDAVDETLGRLDLERCGYTDAALYRAARAFKAYRENGGPRENLLPDFLVGALADTEGVAVLTRDSRRIRTYFPDVEVIEPDAP
jgi:predicted nucleic acid-binding protein